MTKQLYLRDLILMAKAGKKFVAWMEAGAEHPFDLFSKPDVDWTRDEITEPWTCEEIREPEVLYRLEQPGVATSYTNSPEMFLKADKVTKFREVLPGDES